MLRHLRARRRPNSVAHLCALIAAILLLLSVSILYLRLSSPSPLPLSLSLSTPLFPDPFLDSDPDDLNSSSKSDDRIDELDDDVSDDTNNSDDPLNFDDENVPGPSSFKGYFLDHSTGSIRWAFDKRSIDQWEDSLGFSEANLGLGFVGNVDDLAGKGVFGSDDIIVDGNVWRKAAKVKGIEELLMVNKKAGAFGLREGWGDWFDKKSDFLRRDRMFKSNLDLLNVMNYPLLQDPDGVGGLSRRDKLVLKGLLSEFKKVPFLGKKANEGSGTKGAERRTLDDDNGRNEKAVIVADGGGGDGKGVDNVNGGKVEVKSEFSGQVYADGRRWGYYPGLDGRLSFSNFMDAFFRKGKCSLRVFMVWNSPAWAFSVRHQRGLESLLFHHRDACVVMFSETIELNFFDGFAKEGYKIAVAMPNLDELLKETPTHIFASVWFEWKKTKFYPTHFSELVRLAALYKYGGIYLDTDIVVLQPLSLLNNSVALEDELGGHNLNGAVMAFRKHSPFIMDCLTEFYSTYDDTNLRWNGAELLTRVSESFLKKRNHSNKQMELKLLPSSAFFPISRDNITSFFATPASKSERALHDDLFNRIRNESLAFHFWNSLTSALLPEPDSLVARLINHHCIRCSDVL